MNNNKIEQIAPLTKEEQEFIINHYQDMSDQEIADALGRHRVTITNFRLMIGLYKKDEKKEEKKINSKKVDEKLKEAKELDIIGEKKWEHIVGLESVVKNNSDSIEKPVRKEKSEEKSDNLDKESNKENKEDNENEGDVFSFTNDILLREEKLETKKQIKKALPKELWADTDKVIDKFILIKKDFTTEEWYVFLSHWARYLESYRGLLDIDQDFDDLVGIIRELIIQSRLFQESKFEKGKTLTVNKFYNESVKRLQEFKKSLEERIKERKKEKSVGAHTLAEIVKLFDSKEARKAMIETDEEEFDELLSFMEKVKKKMEEQQKYNAEIPFDGNEETLFLGIDEAFLKNILRQSKKILEDENKEEENIEKE